MTVAHEGETTCCYARSDKHWITDPQGIAWEHFHTLNDIPTFSAAARTAGEAKACCAVDGRAAAAPAQPAASCC